MNQEWRQLRLWNGSQNEAFEELCCQLAAQESNPSGSVFTRKGKPDAGVECFWKLPSGKEVAWQAKYLLPPLGTTQWQEIDDSVKTALDKHPDLTAYIVCLPMDRPDARVEGKQSFLQKWTARVDKWEGWANTMKMKVRFSYWGDSEIFSRLAKKEHAGRYFFWFNKEYFSQVWFESYFEEVKASVGERYTPELNVYLPITHLFDGLGRTARYYGRFKEYYGNLLQKHRKRRLHKLEEVAKRNVDSLQKNMAAILKTSKEADDEPVRTINWNDITIQTEKANQNITECLNQLEKEAEKEKATAKKKEETEYSYRREPFEYEKHDLYKLKSYLDELQEFVKSKEANLANVGSLLLLGDGGTGKTHLFCDVTRQRLEEGRPTLMFLGGRFTADEPWKQILRFLDLECTRNDFLGALNTVAEASQKKAIIMIDALNEGPARESWEDCLPSMLKTLEKYPWIAIAVSVRSTYEDLVIPPHLNEVKLPRSVHYGFSEHEYEAVKIFFDNYELVQPSIPLLMPDFQSPLFLKCFCEGLKNKGLDRLPSGVKGMASIFDFFLNSVNEKLSKPKILDYDRSRNLVQQTIQMIAEKAYSSYGYCVSKEEATDITDRLLPGRTYHKSLLCHLIAEGILTEDIRCNSSGSQKQIVYITYERLADHFALKRLLALHLDENSPKHCFKEGTLLGNLFKDERACSRHSGLLDALAITAPEQIGKEVYELLPDAKNYDSIRNAFIESLIWRDPRRFPSDVMDYINKHIIRYSNTHDSFMEAMLIVASNPDHPFNADRLHNVLIRKKLPDRDAWWSTYLFDHWHEGTAIERIIEWAWSIESKDHIDDESVRLVGVTLGWFFTTSHRYLRDRATKALVALMTTRIDVLRKVIKAFLKVNDPYVLERLLAVAYGCALRSTDKLAVGRLAKDTYTWFFKDGTPPVHILTRDYARGVIEVAMRNKSKLAGVDLEKVRPPYKSKWPLKIPTTKDLEKYNEWQENMLDEKWAMHNLHNSVMGHGDFARYVIGTNHGTFQWSTKPLTGTHRLSEKDKHDRFVDSLTKKQRIAWDKYLVARHNSERIFLQGKDFEKNLRDTRRAFWATLKAGKKKAFKGTILPYLDRPKYDREYSFDLQDAQRWIFKRVLDLGWTVKQFGKFDRRVNCFAAHGRSANKPERIGKKYQWIAFYEFLAHVADNLEFMEHTRSDKPEKYDGPWQLLIRNIDPSSVLKKTGRNDWIPHKRTWWAPVAFDNWKPDMNTLKWLKDLHKLPAMIPLINVMNPADDSEWLTLKAFYSWEEPKLPEDDRYEVPRKKISYMLNSYFVRNGDVSKLFRWAKQQNFNECWMPESHEQIHIFLGEFFDSPAFNYHNEPYYYRDGWTRGHEKNIPCNILTTTDCYMSETSCYDCSIDDNILISLPCKWIVDQMGLDWIGNDGEYYDKQGRLVVQDPSVRTPGPGAVLINKKLFSTFQKKAEYSILWTIRGEKDYWSSGMPHEKKWLGSMIISGAIMLNNEKPIGEYTCRYLTVGPKLDYLGKDKMK